MILLVLIIVLALAGGFLGDVLELAAWAVIALATVGAIVGVVIYRTFDRVRGKIT